MIIFLEEENMRLRKEHGIEEKLKSYPNLVILQEEPEKVDWEDVFGNGHPIKIEIGTGKGRFIVELAEKNPQINFIGIELRDQVLLRAVMKADDRKLTNIRFMPANAKDLKEIFEEKSLDGIYLNFSDPWPKKRHLKRRLTHRDFISLYNVILKEDSWVEFKTDNVVLFQFTLNELAELRYPMRKISLDVHEDDRFEDNIMTEYEEKFSKKGNRIMSVNFQTH
jgi:tRNA (guanine-N7-)-methyltransferase